MSGLDATTARMLAQVAAVFDHTLTQHGPGARGMCWTDAAGQQERFRQLLTLIPDKAQAVSINDLGCGSGALFPLLVQQLGDRLGRYVGYDIVDAMLTAARVANPDPRADFLFGSAPLMRADYGLVSGTYNLKLEADRVVWEDWLARSITELGRMSRKGFAFNMLAPEAPGSDDLYRSRPQPWLELVKARFPGAQAELRRGYGLPEWTLLVRLDQ